MNSTEEHSGPPFREWANVELFGHQRVVGLVTEAQIAGSKFLRIEALNKDGGTTTRFYGPSAVYCLTPISEQIARGLAARFGADPISRFDLLKLSAQPMLPLSNEDDQYEE
jgi:hypothetical protein